MGSLSGGRSFVLYELPVGSPHDSKSCGVAARDGLGRIVWCVSCSFGLPVSQRVESSGDSEVGLGRCLPQIDGRGSALLLSSCTWSLQGRRVFMRMPHRQVEHFMLSLGPGPGCPGFGHQQVPKCLGRSLVKLTTLLPLKQVLPPPA